MTSPASASPVFASPVWHPFTQHGAEPPPVRAVGAEGAFIHAADGRILLDGFSSWWVITHGHRHPRIVDAIRDAAGRYDQLCFAGMTHEPAEALAAALLAIAPPGLEHVFYSDSGSTAVEVAVKMAIGFHRARADGAGIPPRTRIAMLQHAYHGDTVGGMSLGARGPYNAAYRPLLFAVDELPFPAPGREAETLAAFERLAGGGELAALVVEPLVLGAGGMRMYPPRVLAGLAGIARAHGVLLVADEVMTGWGRTGALFACERAGIAPDLLCLSKGLSGGALPIAATLATRAVFEAHRSPDRARMLFHSSSFTANPIACAAALANLGIWAEEPVRERVARLGAWQTENLGRFARDPRFAAPRRCGTIAALDLAVADAGYLATIGPTLRRFFLERGLWMRPLGNTIYVMPPYCITRPELDRVYDAIDAAGARFAQAA